MIGLPTSYLESILHNYQSKPGMPKITDDYIIELNNGELVTIKDLCDFWIEGHKKLDTATKIISDAKEIMRKSERKSKEEKKLQTEQKVEGLQAQEECRPEGTGPCNKEEVVQGSESTSQKPKRGRVRKPRE